MGQVDFPSRSLGPDANSDWASVFYADINRESDMRPLRQKVVFKPNYGTAACCTLHVPFDDNLLVFGSQMSEASYLWLIFRDLRWDMLHVQIQKNMEKAV